MKSGSILRPKYSLGTLTIFESLPKCNSGLFIHHIDENRFHDEDFIFSKENLHFFILSIHLYKVFEMIKNIDDYPLFNIDIRDCFISSILSHICSEINAFRKSSNLSEAQMKAAMTSISLFAQFNWSPSTASVPDGRIDPAGQTEEILIGIIGGLQAVLSALFSVKNIWSKQGTVKNIIKDKLHALLRKLTIAYTKEDKKQLRKKIRAVVKARSKEFKTKKLKNANAVSYYSLFLPLSFLLFYSPKIQ